MNDTSSRPPHLVLVAGIGGHAISAALDSLRSVTGVVSLVYVSAWANPDLVRTEWTERALRGEFIAVQDLDDAVQATTDLQGRLPVDGVVTYSELLLRPVADIT